jgi:hypothetical protein
MNSWLRIPLVALSLSLASCAAATPRVEVLGLGPRPLADSMLLFVEVTNPTKRPLEFSRLSYEIETAAPIKSEGEVRVARNVTAGSSAIIEVPLAPGAVENQTPGPIVLKGRLFVKDQEVERSWPISATGHIGNFRSGEAVRIRVASVAVR